MSLLINRGLLARQGLLGSQGALAGRGILGNIGQPSLFLDYSRKTLSPQIGFATPTFTRASLATMIGANGLVRYCPHNTLLYSENFSQATYFTDGSVASNSVAAPNGSMTADTVTLASGQVIRQDVSGIIPNSIYSISVWAKSSATGGAANIRITTNNTLAWTSGISQKFALTDSWQRIVLTGTIITLGNAGPDGRIVFGTVDVGGSPDATCAGNVDLWGAQLNVGASATEYCPTTSAIFYGPRFTHDLVTGAVQGFLPEETRTNLIYNSTSLSNGSWTTVDLTATGNSAVAPDGTTTATLFSPQATTNSHAVYGSGSSVALLNGVVYSVSIFVKAGTGRYVSLRGENYAGSSYPWITLDTQNGTLTANAGVVSSGVTQYANGWYRMWLSWTQLGSFSGNMVLAASDVSTAPATSSTIGNSYLGSGLTFYGWGFQCEAGAFPTSFIFTYAATVTRSADVLTYPVGAWFDGLKGSWFADVSSGTDSGSNYSRIVGYNGASDPTPLFIHATTIGSWNPGVELSYAFVVPSSLAFKAATGYSSTGRSVVANNGTVVSDANTMATPTVIYIGSNLGVQDFINRPIKSIRYYPARLPDQALKSMTV